MKRRLFVRRQVEVAVANVWNELVLDSPQRAQTFLETFDESLDKISAFPYAYAVRAHNVRRVNLKRFSYALFYRVEAEPTSSGAEATERIVVLALIHTRSDAAAASNISS